MSALSGLNATLPMSLIQMSPRKSASTGAFNPPAIMASLNALQRSEISPDGSPMEKRVPSRCRITPGASMVVAGYTTQPMARSGDSTALVAPPGSTASIRRPRYGPGSSWKYHHGIPFCAASTAVSSPSSGSTRGPQDG